MEYYDIYDEFGNKTDKVVPHDYKLSPNEYRAISHIVIFYKDLMLIQKRGHNKIDFPDCFDITAGGGVNHNETTFMAAKRELKEELGLDIPFSNRCFFRVYYKQGIDDYFIYNSDTKIDEIKINGVEVLEIKWASKEEIKEMMKNKEFVSYNDGFIDLLFSMRNNRGTYIK